MGVKSLYRCWVKHNGVCDGVTRNEFSCFVGTCLIAVLAKILENSADLWVNGIHGDSECRYSDPIFSFQGP